MKKKYINITIQLVLVISLIIYEMHIHTKAYMIFQAIIAILTVVLFISILSIKDYFIKFKERIKKSKILILMAIGMAFSMLMALLQYNTISFLSFIIVIMYIISGIFYFTIMPLIIEDNIKLKNKIFEMLIIIISFINLFGIFLFFNNGALGYYLEAKRSGSIYFDPNYFSVISVIPVFLTFEKKDTIIKKIIVTVIAILGVFVSGSRGTLLAFTIVCIFYIIFRFSNKNIIKKSCAIAILTVGILIAFNYLNKISFFRFYQGSSGRDLLIKTAVEKIEESPIFGFGYSNTSWIFYNEGFSVSTSHNGLIDFMLTYGIPCLVMYIILIMKSLYNGFSNRKNDSYLLLTIFLLINMNTILLSFGGVGLPAIILNMSMGYIYYGKRKNKTEYNHTSIQCRELHS